MRRFLLLGILFFSVCFVSVSNSQVLMDENFNYPAGDSLGAHGWISFSGGNTNVLRVATPGLIYSGYPLSNIGNSVEVLNTGQDAYKQFDSVTSNSVYVSFMMRIDAVQATGDYFFALLPSTSTSNYTMRTRIIAEGGGYKIGISKSTEATTYAPLTYNLGTTYLVIVKYTFNSGTNQDDQLSLFVFSGAIPGSEPTATVGPITGTQVDSPDIGRIALRQGSASTAPTLLADGFRVCRSWGNLVGVTAINSVAENFALSQNYPNPFNPSTKINFSIPERGYVTLKVFDMLGKEVDVLASGDFQRGTYAVDYNASALSSGIYLYTLEAVSESGSLFRETKKFTLVK